MLKEEIIKAQINDLLALIRNIENGGFQTFGYRIYQNELFIFDAQPLGAGTYGEVFKAYLFKIIDEKIVIPSECNIKPCVLKIPKPETLVITNIFEQLEVEVHSFNNYYNFDSLHPNRARLFDDGVIIMPFFNGKNLSKVLYELDQNENQKDTFLKRVKLALSLVIAYDPMHYKRSRREVVLHDDIKANNVIINETANGFNVYPLDFGMACLLPSDDPDLLYQSPFGHASGIKNDIRSLGLILTILLRYYEVSNPLISDLNITYQFIGRMIHDDYNFRPNPEEVLRFFTDLHQFILISSKEHHEKYFYNMLGLQLRMLKLAYPNLPMTTGIDLSVIKEKFHFSLEKYFSPSLFTAFNNNLMSFNLLKYLIDLNTSKDKMKISEISNLFEKNQRFIRILSKHEMLDSQFIDIFIHMPNVFLYSKLILENYLFHTGNFLSFIKKLLLENHIEIDKASFLKKLLWFCKNVPENLLSFINEYNLFSCTLVESFYIHQYKLIECQAFLDCGNEVSTMTEINKLSNFSSDSKYNLTPFRAPQISFFSSNKTIESSDNTQVTSINQNRS